MDGDLQNDPLDIPQLLARLDDGCREICDAFLRADQRTHFPLRVEADAEPTPVPIRGGLAKLRQAFVVGITVILGVVGGALESFDDVTRSWQVGVADREADNVDALACDLFFEAIKLSKKVGR